MLELLLWGFWYLMYGSLLYIVQLHNSEKLSFHVSFNVKEKKIQF